jgi:phosphomevalonate kinase
MIQASAPGKVILWGEYAVLKGAPALVMAIDRYASCEIEPCQDIWRFTTKGFATPETQHPQQALLAEQAPDDGAARVVWQVLSELRGVHDQSLLPPSARVVTDTEGFYLRGEKLGIGSSAAICTAVYAAFCRLLDVSTDFDQALKIHNQFQHKEGSGIDVAAAFHGGTLRFQSHAATPWELPKNLQVRFLWTGHAAKTTHHISRFNDWLEGGQLAPLSALTATCHALFEQPDLATLERYTQQLKTLDAAASLGIYSTAHSQLDRLAIDAQVVYKPCGAGGGDMGVAISDEVGRLDQFVDAAEGLGFNSIPLEKARHGIQVTG